MAGEFDSKQHPLVVVVMGVSGSGKTTVAALLAAKLGWHFEEGDSLHSQANVDKMASGQPLSDEDRWPWLERIADWIDTRLDAGASAIITCSALKRSYRDLLRRRGGGVQFVCLSGTAQMISSRLSVRQGHFMPPELLASQIAALEVPGPDEPAIILDVGPAPDVLAQQVIDELGLRVKG